MRAADAGESDDRLADALQLIRSETIGPVSYLRLVARFGSPAAALDALPGLARAKGARLALAPRGAVESEIETARAIGARFILDDDPAYPALLRALPDHPPVLCVRGDAGLFARPAVAIVGARNASGVGRKMARLLAEGLGAAGFVVVSGLARGVDGAAHEAALAAGTIAAVAGGADIVYPPEHDALTAEIAARGAVVSERALGHQPTARDFPRRNRLISGLSLGVVVVEAAARSGTLITARLALEQGREVFAVPGSPLDPRCEGANRLIRDGAGLVERAGDVIEALAGAAADFSRGAWRPRLPRDFREGADGDPSCGLSERDGPDTDDPPGSAALRARILETLGPTPLHRDEIVRLSGAGPAAALDALVDLVLAGEAEETEGGRFARSLAR